MCRDSSVSIVVTARKQSKPLPTPMFAVHLHIVALFLTSFVFLRLRINRQEHDGLARRKRCNLGDSRVPVSEPFCLAAGKRDAVNLEDAPRHSIG
jgi:hypothetical protein